MNHISSCSVAEFGSHVRNDNDSFSDRDCLIVYPAGAFPRCLLDSLTADGRSCSTYSRRRLSRLAEDGSLFIQHLVNESRIVHDPDQFLTSLLSAFTLKSNYNDVFDDAVRIFGLVETIPQHERGVSWAADVVAVAFRAMAIPYLADRGIFAFGMPDICQALTRLGRLSRADAARVPVLRQYKSDYRRYGSTSCTASELTELIVIAERCFCVDLHRHFVSHDDLVVALAKNPIDEWYRGVRLLEALLLQMPAYGDSRIDSLQNMIKSPQVYGWRMKHRRNEIEETLNEFFSTGITLHNKPLHAEPRAARVLKSASFAAAR